MLRYIPNFILDRANKNDDFGAFSGYVYKFDIKNFDLLVKDKLPLTQLQKIIDNVFKEPFDEIVKRNGFVNKIYNGSFTAILPDHWVGVPAGDTFLIVGNPNALIFDMVEALHNKFSDYSVELNNRNIEINICQTVAYGTINWNIIRGKTQNEFYFTGDGFKQMIWTSKMNEDLNYTEGGYLGNPDLEIPVPKVEFDETFINHNLINKQKNEYIQGNIIAVSLNSMSNEQQQNYLEKVNQALINTNGCVFDINYSSLKPILFVVVDNNSDKETNDIINMLNNIDKKVDIKHLSSSFLICQWGVDKIKGINVITSDIEKLLTKF